MDPIWIGSPTDVRTNGAALAALAEVNDCRFAVGNEILKVSPERWEFAQKFEHATWMEQCLHAQSDRNDEHKTNFGNYETLPDRLGRVLEVGCGPFTQLKTILSCRDRHTDKVTLADPLLNDYLKHPNCTYRAWVVDKLAIRAEDLDDDKRFDTIVCINVLEHVLDAVSVLAKLSRLLVPGGHLVFHEKSWNVDLTRLYDVGHPIRVSEKTLAGFFGGFNELYHNTIDGGDFVDHYAILQKPQVHHGRG